MLPTSTHGSVSTENMTMYMDRRVEKKIFLVLQKRLQIYKLTFHNHGVSLLNSLTGATMFLKCAHPAIDGERQREIMWLKDGSAEHQVLQAVANDKKLLTDMDKLSEFHHTGGLENFHSVIEMGSQEDPLLLRRHEGPHSDCKPVPQSQCWKTAGTH